MQTDALAKPQPTPTAVSQGYWDGLKEGRLMLQSCGECGTIRHYPRPVCARCHSLAVEWVEASGRGTIHSWTVANHTYHPAFKAEVPYVLVTVDLEEGVRQMGRLAGDDVSALRLGLPVAFTTVPTENGYALPSFGIVASGSAAAGRPG